MKKIISIIIVIAMVLNGAIGFGFVFLSIERITIHHEAKDLVVEITALSLIWFGFFVLNLIQKPPKK